MKMLIWASAILVLAFSARADVGFKERPIVNNIWMPTGYILSEGEVTVGIGSIGYGINEKVQVGTNVLLFLFQNYNANFKMNFFECENKAFSVGFDYCQFDMRRLTSDRKIDVNSIAVFFAFSEKMGDIAVIHLLTKYVHFANNENVEKFKPEASSCGSEIMTGFEFCLSNKSRLLLECGYDLSFDGPRFGSAMLFGWESFRFKLGASYFSPENAEKFFIMPVIGLWWRFYE